MEGRPPVDLEQQNLQEEKEVCVCVFSLKVAIWNDSFVTKQP